MFGSPSFEAEQAAEESPDTDDMGGDYEIEVGEDEGDEEVSASLLALH